MRFSIIEKLRRPEDIRHEKTQTCVKNLTIPKFGQPE